MIADQHRAANDPSFTSSEKTPTRLTLEEWQFIQHYRQCSTAEQNRIRRALTRAVMVALSPGMQR